MFDFIKKVFSTKKQILSRKVKSIKDLEQELGGNVPEAQLILTPTGDFLIADRNTFVIYAMVLVDKYALSYSLVTNSLIELSETSALISESVKAILEVRTELSSPLALDIERKQVLLGESAVAYTKSSAGPKSNVLQFKH